MNSKTLLNKLQSISKDYYGNETKFNELLKAIEFEVMAENTGFKSTTKKQYNAIVNYLKKQKNRPVLSVAVTIDNVQYFTNSFNAFKFIEPVAGLKTMEDLKKETAMSSYTYPKIERLFPDKENAMYKLTIEDNRKLYNDFTIKNYVLGNGLKRLDFKNENINFSIDYERLNEVYKILGNSELDVYFYGPAKPLLFIDRITGNEAICCPVRSY